MVAVGYQQASSTTPTHTFMWSPSCDDIDSLHRTLDYVLGLDPDAEVDPNFDPNLSYEEPPVFERTFTFRMSHDMAEKLTTMAEMAQVAKADLVRAFLHSELLQYGAFERRDRAPLSVVETEA